MLTNSLSTEVLVIGAGPTGLMAALLLHQCGLKLRIIDKNQQQAHESRALALQSRSLELFQNLGILDKFFEKGMIAPGAQIFINGHQAAELNLRETGAEDAPYPFILMLSQAEIEKILAEELRVRGIEVERETELVAFTQDEQGVVASIVHQNVKTEIHAAYLIGADGAHSTIRHILNLKFEGNAYRHNFLLADCNLEWPLDYSFVKIFMRKTSLGIFFPIHGSKRCRIVAITLPARGEQESQEAQTATTAEAVNLAEVEQAFCEAVGLPLKCSNPVWVTNYRIHHRAVDKYSVNRVFVAGDAAHIHSPVGGQGMNTGLQDVANLVWKIALAIKSKNSKQLLDSYHAERWPVGQKLLKFTDAIFSRMSSQGKLSTTIRNFFVPVIVKLITSLKCYRRKLFYFVSQLGIHYHDKTFLWDDLSHPENCSKKLSPGHRAPDAYYKRNNDIFSLIKGYQFHLLVLAKKPLEENEIKQINAELIRLPDNVGLPLSIHFIANSAIGEMSQIFQSESNDVFNKYGLSEKNPLAVFLIRPDSYIAYRADKLSIQNIENFLKKFDS